ncbi:MAG: ABC transporter permease [Oscillospiraceae bacterium]|nr:ABC transporter permease [Oscillospiraceae bacterium]
MFLSWGIIQSALELGLIYALVALALFLSYSMLNVCDLSTDGCYTLGCAVGSVVAIAGHPVLAIFAAMGAGILSGFITALLQTKLGVESLLAGIIVNTGLYTINIVVMGRSTLSLNDADTVFTAMKSLLDGTPLANFYKLIVVLLFVAVVVVLLLLFLGTRLGLSIRATGNNPEMVKSSSINPALMVIIGLCLSNAVTALAGCLIGEYQKSCDINMGTGMVTIALASLIIGETIFGRKTIPWRAIGVIVGACLYRVVVAIALRFNLPASALKLVSAIIVAVAISYPTLMKLVDFEQKKLAARGRSLYRILTFCFGGVTLACIVLAVLLPGARALFVLLAVLAVIGLIWAVLRDRAQLRKGGEATC